MKQVAQPRCFQRPNLSQMPPTSWAVDTSSLFQGAGICLTQLTWAVRKEVSLSPHTIPWLQNFKRGKGHWGQVLSPTPAPSKQETVNLDKVRSHNKRDTSDAKYSFPHTLTIPKDFSHYWESLQFRKKKKGRCVCVCTCVSFLLRAPNRFKPFRRRGGEGVKSKQNQKLFFGVAFQASQTR